MQVYQTLAELTASRQNKTGTQIACRENLGFYIVQDAGYTPVTGDITVSNGRVVKFDFAFAASNIKTTGGNVQGDLDSIIAGGLPTQSGNKDRVLTTNGTSASWTTVGLEFATTAAMEAVSPTTNGIVAYNQQRANAKYILSTTATAQPGDIEAANGNVWVLQDIFEVDKYGAAHDGSTDDTQAVSDCFARVHAETVYDQQFYGGVVKFGAGSYLITDTIQWRRFSIEGQGSFQTTLLWGGGSGKGMFNKEQANTYLRGVRMTTVGAGLTLADLPDYYIDSDVTGTKVDWAWHMFDVYFGKAGVVSIRTGQPVNFYFERVRWDNSACLLEVNGEGFGSNNRIVSLKDCTVDWTILTGVNATVDCLFRFNLGNSDFYSFIVENWRFEGSNADIGGNALIQLNDLNSPTQELRSRPLQVVFRNVGLSIDNTVAKTIDFIELNTASTNVSVPVTFDNFYQNGYITNLFTSGSSSALSALQPNPVLPLTMGHWVLWPSPSGVSDIPHKFGDKFDFNGVTVESDGNNVYALSILLGDPDSESTILTLSSGAIDLTGRSGLVVVDTEAAAATDDLTDILGGVSGQMVVLRTANNSRDVVVKNGTGNIQLANTGADITLDVRTKTVALIYSALIGAWLEM